MAEYNKRKVNKLNNTEIIVLIILLRKYINKRAIGVTADEVSKEAGLSIQHSYKVLRDLTLKGLVNTTKADSLNIFGATVATSAGKKVMYMPIKEEIIKYRDKIIEWAERNGNLDEVNDLLSKLLSET